MASRRLFTNNAKSTLAAGISNSATTITLAPGTGSLFPSPVSGTNICVATITNATETLFEDVAITSRSGDTLVVVRGYDSSTAQAWALGDKIEVRITAALLQMSVLGPDVEAWALSTIHGAKVNLGGTGNPCIIGVNAMQFTSSLGSYQTSYGTNAGRDHNGGSYNTSVGGYAGAYNATGGYNTSVGYASGAYTTAANGNTCVGANAGALITGNYNTYIGYWNAGTAGSGDNNTVIGNLATKASANDSNSVTLGNSAVTVLRCQVTSITALSDARDKADVKPLTYGRQFIDMLRPVSFVWNMRDGGNVGTPDCGFIAQELKAAQEAVAGADVLRLVYDPNPDRMEASYGRLLPVMVKAIQELSTALAAAEARLAALEGK